MGEVQPPDDEDIPQQNQPAFHRSVTISAENLSDYSNIKSELGRLKKGLTQRHVKFEHDDQEDGLSLS
jgi:hypothetical protein